jgi:hypothetical protein
VVSYARRMQRPLSVCAAAIASVSAAVLAAAPAAAAPPPLSWQVTHTRCVAGVVHLDVSITGAVVGQAYAIYGTSGLRASTEEVVASAPVFTATFTPNDAYGSNDAAHFSVTGDVEAPATGQRSQVRTISATCSAQSRPPATVPSTLSTSLGFDINALRVPTSHHKSHTARDVTIAVVAVVVLAAAGLVARRRWSGQRRS